MKPARPLWVHVWGLSRVWRARVAARLSKGGKWQKIPPELGREVQSTSIGNAAKKALTAYRREPRVCRRCGETWDVLRGRERAECPKCQNRRKVNVATGDSSV